MSAPSAPKFIKAKRIKTMRNKMEKINIRLKPTIETQLFLPRLEAQTLSSWIEAGGKHGVVVVIGAFPIDLFQIGAHEVRALDVGRTTEIAQTEIGTSKDRVCEITFRQVGALKLSTAHIRAAKETPSACAQ